MVTVICIAMAPIVLKLRIGGARVIKFSGKQTISINTLGYNIQNIRSSLYIITYRQFCSISV